MEFQDMLWKCSKIFKVKAIAPGLPHSMALPDTVANEYSYERVLAGTEK